MQHLVSCGCLVFLTGVALVLKVQFLLCVLAHWTCHLLWYSLVPLHSMNLGNYAHFIYSTNYYILPKTPYFKDAKFPSRQIDVLLMWNVNKTVCNHPVSTGRLLFLDLHHVVFRSSLPEGRHVNILPLRTSLSGFHQQFGCFPLNRLNWN